MQRSELSTVSAGRKVPREGALLLTAFEDGGPVHEKGELSTIPGVDGPQLGALVSAAARAEGFGGEAGQTLTIHPGKIGPGCPVVVLGLGKLAELHPEGLRRAMGELARRLPEGLRRRKPARLALPVHRSPWREALDGPVEPRLSFPAGRVPECAPWDLAALVQAAGEGWLLGQYSFLEHQTQKKKTPVAGLEVQLVGGPSGRSGGLRAALDRAEVLASSVVLARDLANTPANLLRPGDLARRCKELARRHGLGCRVLDLPAIRREKMGGLLGVGQGSEATPRFVVLEYRPPSRGAGKKPAKPLVLVGKAVTFDSGGLSIKPSKGMEDMKMDMSGGAAVLAALVAVSQLAPARPVVGLIPAAENMISGRSTRPGDVLKTRSGLTVEVVNTDAEGRLILADALDYARGFKPRLVVDVATLTGACVVALGESISGIMANDPRAADTVRAAAARTGEPVWELPLYREHFDQIRSDVADMKNSGGRAGGAITAAALLARCIEGVPWCHVDIAGTAWTDKDTGYQVRGATGAAVRLLVDLAMAPGP